MAAIAHTDSKTLDSTVSLSPPPPERSDTLLALNAPTSSDIPSKPKRVGRTYGRPKPISNDEHCLDPDFPSREIILETATNDIEGQIIPDSEAAPPPKFVYDWQAKLKAIDEEKELPQNTPLKSLQSDKEFGDGGKRNDSYDNKNQVHLEMCLQPRSPSGSVSPAAKRRSAIHSIASDSDNISPKESCLLNSSKDSFDSFSDTPPTSPIAVSAQYSVKDLGSELQEQSIEPDGANSSSSKRRNKHSAQRSKALSKKDLAEMQKETARLLADQHISLQKPRIRPTHTIASLFDKLKTSSVPCLKDPSDPIASFSSPSSNIMPPASQSALKIVSVMSTSTNIPGNGEGLASDHELSSQPRMEMEDEDTPDFDTIIREDEAKRIKRIEREEEEANKRKIAKDLEERKLKALKSAPQYDSDDDLDIEILLVNENEERPHRCSVRPPPSRKSLCLDDKSLISAAKPTFLREQPGTYKQPYDRPVSQEDLNRALLRRVNKQSNDIEEKKRREYVRGGGHLKETFVGEDASTVQTWLQKGTNRKEPVVEDGESQDEDSDYVAEPAGDDDEVEEEREGFGDLVGTIEAKCCDAKAEMADVLSSDEDIDKENYQPAIKRRTSCRVLESEEEEEEEDVFPQGQGFVEDKDLMDNKENSAMLAFSNNEDKENDPVPRHRERGRVMVEGATSEDSQSETMKQRAPLSLLDSESDFSTILSRSRPTCTDSNRVLQVLHEEDKEATMTPLSPFRQDRHQSGSPPASLLKNMRRSASQNHEDNEKREVASESSLLVERNGFSELFFDKPSQSKAAGKQLLQFGETILQPENDAHFEFTQPNRLLPSVKISATQRREIDEMFGKDQEFKLDEAKRMRKDSTQPNLENAYFGSFVASQASEASPQLIRYPLETLSLDARHDEIEPENDVQPFRRLVKGRPALSLQSTPLSKPELKDAFDLLRHGAIRAKRHHGTSKKLTKSDFVEAEAQESDDELLPGFGGVREEDDEEDETPDAIVEALVDDAMIDENHEKILEKHLEHKAADDAALEKLHKDAVEGKLRVKRRGGDFFSDSESSEDDSGHKRRNKTMKKRKIEGDGLDACEKNPETRAFYREYMRPLADEADKDLEFLGITSSQDQQNEDGEASDANAETITHAEISRIAREVNNQESAVTEQDPTDVTWVEENDDTDTIERVEVESGPLQHKSIRATLQPQFSGAVGKMTRQNERERSRLKAWATEESQSRTAVGRGGFSRKEDIGHDSKKGSRNVVHGGNGSTSERPSKLVRSESSLISHVEKRKGFHT